jgi:hypothetical protein
MIVLNGCSSKVDNTSALTQENKILQQQLKDANDKIAKYDKTYELRNITDILLNKFMDYMIKGDLNSVKPLITSNIIIEKNVLKSIKENAVFEVTDKNIRFRQRWYELADETLMHSGYEYLNAKEGNAENVIMVRFKLENGAWKIDYIEFDV